MSIIDINKLNKLPKHVECDWATYGNITAKDENTLYFIVDKKLIYKGNTLYSGNTTGEGVINDSTIMPFEGFLPSDAVVIEESATSTDGEVLYDQSRNGFVFKDNSQKIIQYYANWLDSYLYNKLDAVPAKARNDKLFYYNNTHYIVINGVLSDLSEIQGYVDNAVKETLGSAIEYTDNEIVQCKSWTNTQITNQLNLKIQYLQNQAAYNAITPVEGVLYLIGDE